MSARTLGIVSTWRRQEVELLILQGAGIPVRGFWHSGRLVRPMPKHRALWDVLNVGHHPVKILSINHTRRLGPF